MEDNKVYKNTFKKNRHFNVKKSISFSNYMEYAINIAEKQLTKQLYFKQHCGCRDCGGCRQSQDSQHCVKSSINTEKGDKKTFNHTGSSNNGSCNRNCNFHAQRDVYSEIPIGCVIVDNDTNKIVACAHNETIKTNNSTKHAEIVCINKAMKRLKTNRLTNCSMYVTLEPCCMCAGAISLAKIDRLYIGCLSEKTGAIVSNLHYFLRKICNHRPDIYYPIMEEKCRQLLRGFFRDI